MRKMLIVLCFLTGCAAQPAYQAQVDAVAKSADALTANITELQQSVEQTCGNEFNTRFGALIKQADALRVEIQSIGTTARAELRAAQIEIEKRNLIIAGLVALLIAAAYYGIKKTRL